MRSFQKIVNKAKYWSKHGQHKGMAQEVARRNREHPKLNRGNMVSSLKELFNRNSPQ